MLLANSATWLMTSTLLLLAVGNLALGIIEGAIIARITRAPAGRCITLMIIANYASAAVGSAMFGLVESPSFITNRLFELPLYAYAWITPLYIAIAFAATVLVEIPFCVAGTRKSPRIFRVRARARAFLTAQAVTYCMVVAYVVATDSRTITDHVTIVRDADIAGDLSGRILFVRPGERGLWAIDLDGENIETLVDCAAPGKHDAVVFVPPRGAETPLSLTVAGTVVDGVLDPALSNGRFDVFRDESGEFASTTDRWFLGTASIADLRDASDRQWSIRPRGNGGLTCTNQTTGEQFTIGFETSFEAWWTCCVTALPGDVIVFEMQHQICLLNLRTRQITALCRGQGPVVILDAANF